MSGKPGNSGSKPGFGLDDELETLQSNWCRGSNEGINKVFEKEFERFSNKTQVHKQGFCSSLKNPIEDDERKSDLEYQLNQEEINLGKLQDIASRGIPEGGSFRATTWKLLLGYIPPSRALWQKVLSENRLNYLKLKEEYLSSPCTEIAEQIDRDLQRTHPELMFFSGNSMLSKKHKESMRNILLLFAKLNPTTHYVQGMNEVLAPVYYIFSTDSDEENCANAEADSFACFVRLLSDSVDHFCQQLDGNSSVGIHSTLSRLNEMLKLNDEELWHHLEVNTKVNPQFYGFRWITCLLTQEFPFHTILRIWDSLLSNASGVQDMLLRVCCAMLICTKSRLLSGDFAGNLDLLLHYPEVDIEHLLQVARDIVPDSSTFCVS